LNIDRECILQFCVVQIRNIHVLRGASASDIGILQIYNVFMMQNTMCRQELGRLDAVSSTSARDMLASLKISAGPAAITKSDFVEALDEESFF
jgi:hypothetical protein